MNVIRGIVSKNSDSEHFFKLNISLKLSPKCRSIFKGYRNRRVLQKGYKGSKRGTEPRARIGWV